MCLSQCLNMTGIEAQTECLKVKVKSHESWCRDHTAVPERGL